MTEDQGIKGVADEYPFTLAQCYVGLLTAQLPEQSDLPGIIPRSSLWTSLET